MELNEDNLIKEYFSRSHIVTIHFSKCKKSNLLTTLRIIGNKLNQYVCSIRYRDILEYDCDDMEIYNTVTNNASISSTATVSMPASTPAASTASATINPPVAVAASTSNASAGVGGGSGAPLLSPSDLTGYIRKNAFQG